MSYKYFKPIIKYVSRKAAIQKLFITEKQFNRLTVILGIYPFVPENKNCYDKVDGWYYRLEDIRKIFYSGTYEILKRNKIREKKRDQLLKFKQIERASKVIDEEFSFSELVKQKYKTLGQSVDGFGSTLRSLYFIDLLGIDDVITEREMFENFVTERELLRMSFMSRKGVYFGIRLEKVLVFWIVPYRGKNLGEMVEEKMEAPSCAPELDFDFFDFGSSARKKAKKLRQ